MQRFLLTGEKDLYKLIENVVEKAIDRAQRRSERREDIDKKWMTNEEVQEYLGLSPATLQRYRSSGKLQYSKVGANVYYRREDVLRLLEENSQ